MFHSAAVRLTIWYLGIIMVLSIIFSVLIYNISGNEIINNNRRQNYFLNDRLPTSNFNNFNALRQQDIDEGLKQLRLNLLLFNLMVLVAGGAISYALARKTLEPIEDALEAQKRFTGDASHELRTPLTVIQAETEVALRDKKLTKEQAVSQLKSNLEEVAKLKALSDGLLRLASLDKQDIEFTSTQLDAAAKSALRRWEPIAQNKHINIKRNINPAAVLGDKASLEELCSILIDNAVKYSPRNSEIEVSTSVKAKQAVLSVVDHGSGIKASELPRIFDRFYRVDPSRTSADGHGLGLSIAKRIVETHNGNILVKSTLGKGTTFTVKLACA